MKKTQTLPIKKQRPIGIGFEDRLAGVELIKAERLRQISQEGWSPEHDDKHRKYELSLAASSYLNAVASPDEEGDENGKVRPCYDWPWSKKWWKPSDDPVRNLVKAGALIAAEIDRLERQKAKPAKRPELRRPGTKSMKPPKSEAKTARRNPGRLQRLVGRRRVKLKFMVVPELLATKAYVPNAVRCRVVNPEAIFLTGILGESGRKLVAAGIEFYFTRKLADQLINAGIAVKSSNDRS